MAVDFDVYISKMQLFLLRATPQLCGRSEAVRFQTICEETGSLLADCPADYEKRSIFMFLLLNGDAKFVDNFAVDRNFAHLIDTLPRLSQELIFQVILNVNGLYFLKELITFSPAAISIPVLKMISCDGEVKLPYRLKNSCVSRELTEACFHRLVIGCDGQTEIVNFLFHRFGNLQESHCQCIAFEEECDSLVEPFRKAQILIHYMHLCLFCMQINFVDHSQCWEGYLVKCSCSDISCSPTNSEIQSRNELLGQYRNLVVSKCLEVIRDVSAGDWIEWSEKDFEPLETCQSHIGKTAYQLRLRLEEYTKEMTDLMPTDLHCLVESLIVFAPRVQSKNDEVESTSLDDIKQKLKLSDEKGESQKLLKALLRSPTFLCDEEALELLGKKCHLFDENDIEYLLGTIYSMVHDENTNHSDKEILKFFSYQVIMNCSERILLSVFKSHIEKHGVSFKMCDIAYDCRLVKAFNKRCFSGNSSESDSEDHELNEKWRCDIISLAIQNPVAVVQKSLEVGLQNASSETASEMANILGWLLPVSQIIVLEWITTVSEKCTLNKTQVHTFPDFVWELLKTNVLPRNDFLRQFVLKALGQMIALEDWGAVCMWLKTMQKVILAVAESQGEVQVAILAFYLGQILEICQQPASGFDYMLIHTREATLEVLNILQGVCIPDETELDWLRSNASKFSLLTQYHLVHFWSHKCPENVSVLFEFCFSVQVTTSDYASYVLTEMLPFITCLEWRSLAIALKQRFAMYEHGAYSIFLSFLQATLIIYSAISGSKAQPNSKHVNCLNHCIHCLGDILNSLILPNLESAFLIRVLTDFLGLLNKLPSEVWCRAGMDVLPQLVKLMRRIIPKVQAFNELSIIISKCPADEPRALFENQMKLMFSDVISDLSLKVNDG